MKQLTILYHKYMLFMSSLLALCFLSCDSPENKAEAVHKDSMQSCSSNMPSRFASSAQTQVISQGAVSKEGMILVKSSEFLMGAADDEGRQDEYPQHKVKVNDFWMDATEVTNAQFAAFVKATGYITTAEKAPDWEELKKQLPEGTPKPDESVLVASSLIFKAPKTPVSLQDHSQWWDWAPGADWKHPDGPG